MPCHYCPHCYQCNINNNNYYYNNCCYERDSTRGRVVAVACQVCLALTAEEPGPKQKNAPMFGWQWRAARSVPLQSSLLFGLLELSLQCRTLGLLGLHLQHVHLTAQACLPFCIL